MEEDPNARKGSTLQQSDEKGRNIKKEQSWHIPVGSGKGHSGV